MLPTPFRDASCELQVSSTRSGGRSLRGDHSELLHKAHEKGVLRLLDGTASAGTGDRCTPNAPQRAFRQHQLQPARPAGPGARPQGRGVHPSQLQRRELSTRGWGTAWLPPASPTLPDPASIQAHSASGRASPPTLRNTWDSGKPIRTPPIWHTV